MSRTHDQDSDADLWKETNFFGRKITRYLCLSKTEGIADYVVENVGVVNEKEAPPDGFCLIPRTIDSGEFNTTSLNHLLSNRLLKILIHFINILFLPQNYFTTNTMVLSIQMVFL